MVYVAQLKAIRCKERQFIENLNGLLTLAVEYDIKCSKFVFLLKLLWCIGLSAVLTRQSMHKYFFRKKTENMLVTNYRYTTIIKLFSEINLLIKCSLS